MTAKRRLLAALSLLAVPGFAWAKKSESAGDMPFSDHLLDSAGSRPPPTQARGGNFFPNVPAYSHTGKKYRFYDDLLHGRVVLLNFMSVSAHQAYPVTEYLLPVADRLGDRLGREIYFLSITTDPLHDTPAQLRQLAEQYGAIRPGWFFLTTSRNSVAAVSKRLFKHGKHAGHAAVHPLRMVHYGNASAGVWGACGADCNPDLLVDRLMWVQSGTADVGSLVDTPRRAGPRRLGEDFTSQNREV